MDSLDLYLDYPANRVVAVDELVDSTGGLYPVYYRKDGENLKISTSVSALIKEMGNFKYNQHFRPNDSEQFLNTFETIDTRVSRLKPFEIINREMNHVDFRSTWELKNIENFLKSSVQYFIDFVQSIERIYPEKKHVVLTGGRDSRLTLLVPKLDPSAWYIFSSQPDLYYVRRWLKVNRVEVAGIFEHSGFRSEEDDLEMVKKKIIASDGYFDTRHARWILAQKQIAEHFHGQCIFWTGDTGLIYIPNPFCKDPQKRDFFSKLLIRASLYHGSKNQLIKNLTGCPRLTMYHSPMIWKELYSKFDFSVVDKDYRETLGDHIAGRKICWEAGYPPIEWWEYPFSYNMEEIYLDYIRGLV